MQRAHHFISSIVVGGIPDEGSLVLRSARIFFRECEILFIKITGSSPSHFFSIDDGLENR